jgi:predicted SnoaL-like aldol condensation-catalyzing enzyme
VTAITWSGSVACLMPSIRPSMTRASGSALANVMRCSAFPHRIWIVEPYAGPTYRQHNPLIEDGMGGVRKFVASIMADHPDAHGEIKRVFADGDYVILHSHWHGLSDNPRGEAVVDIFRLENGKMVEHWDVIQPIPETAANNNTMF